MSDQKGPKKSAANDENILNDSEVNLISDEIADALDLDASEEDVSQGIEVIKEDSPDLLAPDTTLEPAGSEFGNTAPELDESALAQETTEGGAVTSAEGLESEAVEDKDLDKAINDIADENKTQAKEGSKVENVVQHPEAQPKKRGGLAGFFARIWANPKSRTVAILGSVVFILVLGAVPQSRYFILNAAQIRASVELTVLDSTTLQPLKNVTVTAGGSSAKTNSEGFAKLEKAKLGSTKLIIQKRAFSEHSKDITIGWGSNPLGEFRAEPVGAQYTFYVSDKFSAKPISKAEASSGEGNAVSDKDGKIVLTLDTAELDDSAQVSVDITSDGYRKETVNITVNNKEKQSVAMVPSRKHVFVSKRSGNYDLYTVDMDGKNETRIIGGSGYERDDMALVPHSSENFAAYAATRENTRNQSGYLLTTLYVVNLENGESVKIDQAEQVKIIGWTREGRLVYIKIAAGASGNDPKRHRLMSFDVKDFAGSKELASANAFNDVVMAEDKVYYAPANYFNESTPAVFAVNADGSNSAAILDKEAYSIVRTDYNKLYLSASEQWYEYILDNALAASSHAPNNNDGRVYTDSPDGKTSVWIDQRDGKGVLLSFDKESKQEKVLAQKGGLKLPLYFVGNRYVVYRISDGRETADYILSLEGGEPSKIVNATDTYGIKDTRYF